jgi:hypothetical protein
MPSIPYGWQETKTTTAIKSCRSKRINILGLMNRKMRYIIKNTLKQ